MEYIPFDRSPTFPSQSINMTVVNQVAAPFYKAPFIIGYGEIGYYCIGYHPFVIGVSKIGDMI